VKVSGLAIELILFYDLFALFDNRTERLCILLTTSSTVSLIPPVQPLSSLSSMSVGFKRKKYCPKIVASDQRNVVCLAMSVVHMCMYIRR